MIHLFRIREHGGRKSARLLSPPLSAPDLDTLFNNLDSLLAAIPVEERWNLYYSACHTTSERREFRGQDCLPFDIDQIDPSRLDEYTNVVYQVLGLSPGDAYVIFSGNGIQMVLPLQEPIQDEAYFLQNRPRYRALCDRIDQALSQAGLPGKADPSVFSPARLLRLPGTRNVKPGKPEREANLLAKATRKVRSPLLSVVPPESSAPKTAPRVDTEGVLNECLFLRWAKEHAAEVSEPQWYAALSILGRLQDGRRLAHEYSRGHPLYQPEETDAKLEQALAASGPRTCANIETLWTGCHRCIHSGKITSPISIKSKNFIATRDTGFHEIIQTRTGIRYRPVYEDLRRFFEQQNPYLIMGASRICYRWTGTHYTEYDDIYIDHFAQTHFHPPADNRMISEFRGLVHRTNVRSPDWFDSTTRRKINFANGVLDLQEGTFREGHDPGIGFRHCLPYHYDPQATCPRFDRFLAEVTGNDASLQQALLEFGGYALSNDDYWVQMCLLLVGSGNNGKSTFLDLLRALAGPGNHSALSMAGLQKETNLQMLDGKLFNIAEETPFDELRDTSILKTLASGGTVTVRRLYKDPYTMRNRAKLIFACNELPSSRDTTDGFHRRLLIVPFTQAFTDAKGNKDPFLEAKLLEERPGIFNRFYEAYQRLRARGRFLITDRVLSAAESYRQENDYTRRWLQENLEILPLNGGAKMIPLHDLYQEYALAMERSRMRPLNALQFSRKLSQIIPDFNDRYKRVRIDEKRVYVLLDVILDRVPQLF